MPYLIFVIGILIGAYAFYRYFISAKPADIRLFFRNALIGVYLLIIVMFALLGKILVSLALLILALPFVISYYKGKQSKPSSNKQDNEH
ncbi:MAG: hypothetical protein ACRBDI_03110 [Alphaproteobacteria bacterium]